MRLEKRWLFEPCGLKQNQNQSGLKIQKSRITSFRFKYSCSLRSHKIRLFQLISSTVIKWTLFMTCISSWVFLTIVVVSLVETFNSALRGRHDSATARVVVVRRCARCSTSVHMCTCQMKLTRLNIAAMISDKALRCSSPEQHCQCVYTLTHSIKLAKITYFIIASKSLSLLTKTQE